MNLNAVNIFSCTFRTDFLEFFKKPREASSCFKCTLLPLFCQDKAKFIEIKQIMPLGMDKYFSSCIITSVAHYGPVAHLVERLTCTEEVAGSSPVRSTQY